MTKYEAIFILDQRRLDDGGDSLAQEVSKHIESLGGRVESSTSLGRKQFARPIRKQQAGVYWHFVMELDPGQVAAFLESYRLNEAVFRTEVLHYEAPPERQRRAR